MGPVKCWFGLDFPAEGCRHSAEGSSQPRTLLYLLANGSQEFLA